MKKSNMGKIKFEEIEKYVDPVNGLWGFGSPIEKAKVIFVGPEFGGGKDPDEIRKRVKGWETLTRGKHDKKIIDSRSFESAVYGNDDNFWVKGKQQTFDSLLRILPSPQLNGEKGSDLNRRYYEHYFSRKSGVSFIDISPLSSKNMSADNFSKIYAFARNSDEFKILKNNRNRQLIEWIEKKDKHFIVYHAELYRKLNGFQNVVYLFHPTTPYITDWKEWCKNRSQVEKQVKKWIVK